MSNAVYVIAAVFMGVCLAFQPPINAAMARLLGSPLLAACISITISFVAVAVLWLAWSKGSMELAAVRGLPWWVWLGGLVGLVFVGGSLVVAPVLGVAPFFVFVVAGQLAGSTVIDQVGAFGMQVRPVNPLRLLGLTMVLIGSVLVQGSE